MRNIRLYLLLLLLPFVGGGIAADNAFDPSSPPEPGDVYKYKHNIIVNAVPEGKAYASGTGRYVEGARVSVGTSAAEANWYFVKWQKNGVDDTAHRSTSFTYTMEDADVTFTAVYEYREPEDPGDPTDPENPPLPEFDPTNPAEPEVIERPTTPDPPVVVVVPKYVLNLVNEPREAASFNMGSGNSYAEGTSLTIRANGSQYFEFVGWFDKNGTKISDSLSITYIMPGEDMTLTARWSYNPGSPDDPFGDPQNPQTDIDNTVAGDVTGDREVDVMDIQRLLNIMAGNYLPSSSEHSGDVNGDNDVDVMDIQRLLNIMAGN